jgi:hypothetical protein
MDSITVAVLHINVQTCYNIWRFSHLHISRCHTHKIHTIRRFWAQCSAANVQWMFQWLQWDMIWLNFHHNWQIASSFVTKLLVGRWLMFGFESTLVYIPHFYDTYPHTSPLFTPTIWTFDNLEKTWIKKKKKSSDR